MNTEYDVRIRNRLKECMLAGLLAKFPKKTPFPHLFPFKLSIPIVVNSFSVIKRSISP